MEKREIVRKLEFFADLLEFHEENPFKIRAFRSGANIIRRIEGNVEEMLKNGSLQNIKGIGKGLASFLSDLVLKGESPELVNLLEKTPEGILEILSIRGLGAKKVRQLFNELKIEDLDSLEYACKEHTVAALKGFGSKTEEKILQEIQQLKARRNTLLLDKAEKVANEVIQRLSEISLVKRIEATGELRRIREVIKEIEILVLAESSAKFKTDLKNLFEFEEKIEDEAEVLLLKTSLFGSVKLFVTEADETFETLLLKTTGSKEFLQKVGFENCKNEKEFFEKKGLDFIPPEMREYQYFEVPESLKTPSNLAFGEMKGLLHFHTVFSDGMNSLEEMLRTAEKLGFRYAAVCDHSKSAYYANGLSEEKILEQRELIKKLQADFEIKILQGIESDILNDGSLDYPVEILSELDFVVASVHSNFGMSEEEMTARIIRAVENPYTDVLGHPTGRLLLRRDAYKLNIRKIIDACAANSVAIEINANPYRLDLDWRNVYYAREKGCLLSINADAHSTNDILYTEYGLKIARKAGVQTTEVINFFDYPQFRKFLNRKVKRNLE